MYNWLLSVIESFDGSDIFAFIAGCLAMIAWKNFQAMKWNRSAESGGNGSITMDEGENGTAGEKEPGRKISLPKMNTKIIIWLVVLVTIVGTLWSSIETNRSIRATADQTKAVAIAVCENAKVSGVERKALQDLLLAALNNPYQNAPQDDPARKEYGQKITLDYLGALEDAAQQRKDIQEGKGVDPDFWERYFGPDYPEPDCHAVVNPR